MNWSEIYDKELFLAPNCYLTCNGYCCNNFFGKYYSILDKESVILPMVDDEYQEYKKRGGIKNVNAKRYSIKIEDKEFVFYLLSCKEKGLCNPHQNRPLICKIYPYIPKVDTNGKIIDFNFASLMDIFYSFDEVHSCTLVKKEADRIKSDITRNLPKLDGKITFALILIDEAIKNIKKYLPQKIDTLSQNEQKKFIKKFEMLMLSGKAFKEIDIQKLYEKVKNHYGEFL
jgi:Fe-S-cluster containining protein